MNIYQAYRNIKSSVVGKVSLIELNRPEALNAVCSDLMAELDDAFAKISGNIKIGAVVLTGSPKSFAGTSMPSL